MRHPPIIPARHSQGLAAYRSGQSIRDLIGITEEVERLHETAQTREEHEEIHAAGPSLIAGFADGLIEDIRLIASARRGQRA